MADYRQADDSDLMAQVVAGDKQAFGELMHRYLPLVLTYNKQYLPQEAEDVTQEAFIRLWNKAPAWRDRGISPKAWLLRVSYNLCIDELRRRKTEGLEQQDAPLSDPLASSERRLSAQTDLQQQLLALRSLPERQRDAIILCACSGLNNSEAATVMGISVDALEALLSRGRRKLKQTFALATGYASGDCHDYD